MRFFSELFRCKSILYFSYPSQFVPDPFISLSVLFVDNQIRFVSSHFFSNAPQTEPLISHSYQINSMPIRVSANPIFSISVRFRSTAVQIDPFLGLSRLSGASPTRLDPFPSWAVQVSSTHFLIASYLVSSFPLPIPSKHFRCVSSRSFRFLVFSVHLHVCTVRCFSGAYPLGPLSAPISVLGEELPDPPR